MDNKRIIKDNITRKSIQNKIDAALAKKPTAAHTNVLKKPIMDPQNKQKLIQERLIRNGKNNKRFSTAKPQTVPAEPQIFNLNEVSFHATKTFELPTPTWFRSTEKADISIIIPMFKSNDVILDLIKTWPLNNDNLNVEIIFVEDKCPKNCKDVVLKAWNMRKSEIKRPIGKILYNAINSGYGTTCNAGANAATGDYLIFLNADTKVTEGWIQSLIDVFEDSTVGLVGNLQLKQGGGLDGSIDSAGSEWRWGHDSFVHIGRHSWKRKDIAEPFRVNNAPPEMLNVCEREMVTGCCFAMKANLFKYIGGFNPNYKIGYWEDSEICMNVRELGYKVMFTPHSVIYHKLGHTSSGGHKFFYHNKEYFKNKWIKSGRLQKLLLPPQDSPPVKRILIKRAAAHGDALIATGVCAALKKQNPDVKIVFSSLFKEVALDNPYIDEFVDIQNISKVDYDVFYNLDLAYELRPNVNIVTAYAEFCGVKAEDCKVHLSTQKYKSKELPEDFIIIHPGKTNWVGRDWPHENFVQLANILLEQGEKIVCIGKHSEEKIPCTLNIYGETSIAELAWVMKKAKLFIGIDSFPMHVAQAVDTPGVAFFGCVKPELRIYNQKMIGVTAKNLSCLGCHHRQIAPATVIKHCETVNLDCIKQVSVQDMLDAVQATLKGEKNDLISLVG